MIGARLGEHGSPVESWQFDWAGNPLPPLTPDTPKPQDWSERVRQHWQDPNFNLLGEGTQVPSEQVAYWPDNSVLYSADTQYQYDAQGNRTQHIEHKGEAQRYYYNQLNQLQRVDRYSADNRLIRSLYRYDPLGRRLVKQVEHYSIKDNQLHEAADTEVEFYGWDGDRLVFTQTEENQWHVIYEPESFTPLLQLQQPTDTPISEQDKVLAEVMGSLQSTLDYLPAHEAYELSRSVREQTIAQLKANEQWQTPELPDECYFYHCNHLGLPEALTNQKGEAVWAASYDAWGNVKEEHNPNNLHQPIRLPGQYHDKETDLYYNRHRYYDPKLGNYINQDPIGLASGEPNLMAYPRNPIQIKDPYGLLPSLPRGNDNSSVGFFWNRVLDGEVRDDLYGIKDYPAGVFDFFKNYFDMRDANTIGGDKYFHCKANCEAAQHGNGGANISRCISDGREWFDMNVKGDSPEASADDQAANYHGRREGAVNPQGDCRQICSVFRPNGLPQQY